MSHLNITKPWQSFVSFLPVGSGYQSDYLWDVPARFAAWWQWRLLLPSPSAGRQITGCMDFPLENRGRVLPLLIVHQQVKCLAPEWSITNSFSYYPHCLHPAPWFWLESSGGGACTIHGEEFWEFSSESNSILTTAVLHVHGLSHLGDCQGRAAAPLALRTCFFQQIFAIAVFLKHPASSRSCPGLYLPSKVWRRGLPVWLFSIPRAHGGHTQKETSGTQ